MHNTRTDIDPLSVPVFPASGEVAQDYAAQFAKLSPDGQLQSVNTMLLTLEGEAEGDQYLARHVIECLTRIRDTEEPVSFLTRSIAVGGPEIWATSKEVIAAIRERGNLIAGHIPMRLDGYGGEMSVAADPCKDVFAELLPNASEQSEQRFRRFWSGAEAPAIVKSRFGVDMLNLGLQDQVNVINFVIDMPWNSPRLQQMESFFALNGPEKGVAALRALEFGDDYGDSILGIAQHATSEQSAAIFDTIASFRESSAAIASWYESYDPQLAGAFRTAMNERLADALYAMEALTRDGCLNADVAPHRDSPDYENDSRFEINLNSIDGGIEILQNLEKSLRLQHEIITAPDVQVARVVDEGNQQFMVYRFASQKQGDVLLYVRPQGAKGSNRDFEYGNRKGVEASISFIVNPTDPHHLRSDKDPQGVSIRFDREGRLADESPSSEQRDPTRADGSISLDISSSLGDGRHMPVKIGRLIAAGNILRAEKTGSEVSLHHNNNHFDQQRYGNQEGFAKLAIYVAHMAEAMISMQQHGSHGSRYASLPGILRQAGVEPAA